MPLVDFWFFLGVYLHYIFHKNVSKIFIEEQNIAHQKQEGKR